MSNDYHTYKIKVDCFFDRLEKALQFISDNNLLHMSVSVDVKAKEEVEEVKDEA